MRTIRISEEVWDEIAKRGKFGETPDIVLRRVFELEKPEVTSSPIAQTIMPPIRASQRMQADVARGLLIVRFANGAEKFWKLPSPSDKAAIRTVRDYAVKFAAENGASQGQQNAVMKALTSNGYWVSKAR